MGKFKVLVTRPVPEQVEQYIDAHCEAVYWRHQGMMSKEWFLEHVPDVEGIVGAGVRVDSGLLEAAHRLKVISNVSVGYNNFDTDLMKKHGVLGTNTPYVLDDTVADLIVALMLSAARRIPELDQLVKQGNWQRGMDAELFGVDLHHSKVGIIGMGRIGEEVARRARFGFQCEIMYHNRSRKPEIEAELDAVYGSLSDVLTSCDFIVLMTPFTAETKHLIGKDQFASMKRTAVFVNASRGATVDEEALYHALSSGQILAAGLDVFQQEPLPAGHPLTQLVNAVTLPHIGSATEQTRFDMAMDAAKSMVAVLQGKRPISIVAELKDV